MSDPVLNQQDTDPAGSRPVSIPHLVMGLIFLGVVAVWALAEAGVVEYDGQRWILPLVLVVAGGIGLLVSVVNGVRRSRRTSGAPTAGATDPRDDDGATEDTAPLY